MVNGIGENGGKRWSGGGSKIPNFGVTSFLNGPIYDMAKYADSFISFLWSILWQKALLLLSFGERASLPDIKIYTRGQNISFLPYLQFI